MTVKPTLHKTLSFWTALGGTVALSFGQKKVAVWLWRICGLGGVGAVYGAYAGYQALPVEPIRIVTHVRVNPERGRALYSLSWHAVFWFLAEVVDARRR